MSDFVPGAWRCPKCNFRLLQSNLNASDGMVTARDTPGDKCPNCDGPLWRVSWKDEADENMAIAENQLNRALRAEKALNGTRAELKCAIDHLKHMAAFVSSKRLGYSFESLGEDMPGMEAALTSESSRDQILLQNLRDAFDAMCAMRNAINEHIPMPSLESDLLQGPETSVFCSAVAEAVISAVKERECEPLTSLIREAADFIADERENIFCAHQINGALVIDDDNDQRAASIIEDYDNWLARAKALLYPHHPSAS